MSGLSDGGSSTAGPAFADMLALMANPQALQAKYADFQAKQKASEDAIALVGPAKDVLRLREEAAKDRAEAKSILEQARQRVVQMANEAQGSAVQVGQMAKEKSDNLIKLAESEKGVAAARLAEVTQAKADQVKQQAALDARDKTLTLTATSLEARETNVSAREAAVTDRENNLMAVRDRVVAQFAEHAKTLKKV